MPNFICKKEVFSQNYLKIIWREDNVCMWKVGCMLLVKEYQKGRCMFVEGRESFFLGKEIERMRVGREVL